MELVEYVGGKEKEKAEISISEVRILMNLTEHFKYFGFNFMDNKTLEDCKVIYLCFRRIILTIS